MIGLVAALKELCLVSHPDIAAEIDALLTDCDRSLRKVLTTFPQLVLSDFLHEDFDYVHLYLNFLEGMAGLLPQQLGFRDLEAPSRAQTSTAQTLRFSIGWEGRSLPGL